MHIAWSVRRWTPVLLALACLAAVVPGTAAAQADGTIRGQITDEATQRPLANAQVVLVGQNRETRTDAQGRFELRGVAPGEYTIRVLSIGFGRLERLVTVTSGQTADADFALGRAVVQLEEVIVTGTAGRTEKREIGNAITSLQVDDLVDKPSITSVNELLNARAPGLTMYKNSGLVGTASNVKIRGAGSLNAGYVPVYYIDGIRFESTGISTLGSTNSTIQNRSPLEFLDPADIERVEVIKGPAAATLYGADAAGGVIQIITKKGQRGADQVQWNVRLDVGQSDWAEDTPTTYYQCNAARIRNANSFPGCNDPGSLVYEGPNGPVTGIPESEIIRNDAWGDSLFVVTDNPLARHPRALRDAGFYGVRLSARGGGQLFNYYLSFNRQDEEGVFFNNQQERTGGRANFGFTPTAKLDLGLNFGYTRSILDMPLSDNASNGLLRNGYRGRARATADAWEPGYRGFGPDQSNEFDLTVREERTTIGLTASFDPWSWFENRLVLGLDKYDVRETNFFQIDSTAKWGATEGTGQITQRLPFTHTWTVDYSGSVRAPLTAELTSRSSVGMQLNARQYRRYTTTGEGLVANNVNLVGTAAVTTASEGFDEQTSLGFYVQEQIGWRDRLFVTGAVRIDDNSAFGSNFSLVAYPKFSASYVISEEGYFNGLGLSFLDHLKLRAAWGQAGNAPAPFTADRTVQADIVTIEDQSTNALRPSEFGNPDLKAETGSEWEIGFDASLLRGALGLEVTYYNQHTRDALMEIPDAPSSGFPGTHLVNIGEIANSGFELLATASPVRKPSFQWDLTATFATNSNELVSFGGTREEVIFGAFDVTQRHREGYPLGGFWVTDVARDASGNPILNAAGNVTVNASCTWPDPVDPDGYGGTCAERFVGSSVPTREFGLSNTFTVFGNLRIFGQLDYKGGFYQYCAICSINARSDQNDWLSNDPDADSVARKVHQSTQTASRVSKGDFLKIREIALTYSIPTSWGGPFRVARYSFTVSARNLVTFTGYDGLGDPEVLWSRSTADGGGANNRFEVLDYASVPPPRRITASLNVNF